MSEAGAPPLRVAILCESFHPNLDGQATQVRAISGRLRERGLAPFVVTRRDHPEYPRHERVDGVPVRRVGPGVRFGLVGRYLALWTTAPPLLARRGAVDVLFVSNLRILGVTGLLVARSLGVPCVLRSDSCGELSGDYALEGLGGWARSLARRWFRLRNALLRRADAFVSISTATAGEFRDAGLEAERIVAIPNGVDTGAFRPIDAGEKRSLRARLGLPDDAPVAVYCGRLTREKGLDVLLEAWERVQQAFPSARLRLVGSGAGLSHSSERELRARVAGGSLASSVDFAGRVDDVRDALRSADLAVLPSRTEALPLALVEALACGLPVVATRVGGIPDVVRPGESGLLVDPEDPQVLADALCTLLGDPALRARLGATGREDAVARFDLDDVTERYRRLFASLALR